MTKGYAHNIICPFALWSSWINNLLRTRVRARRSSSQHTGLTSRKKSKMNSEVAKTVNSWEGVKALLAPGRFGRLKKLRR